MDVLPVQAQAAEELPPDMKDGLLIFQKNLLMGKVKTRLAETMGDRAAFEAYQRLVDYTHQAASKSPIQKILFFSDYLEEDVSNFPQGYRFELQSAGGLGEKMGNAFQKLFGENFDRLVIIGTDCAEITPEIISRAFDSLEDREVVIGPAKDGGYYLLGMREFHPGLFEGIPWSTDQVASLTLDYLAGNRISYAVLPTLADVDVEADWIKVKNKL